MPAFTTVTCDDCGTEFKALDAAAAADTGYCSPACHTAGEGLA